MGIKKYLAFVNMTLYMNPKPFDDVGLVNKWIAEGGGGGGG